MPAATGTTAQLGAPGRRFADIFPFHWADFILPTLLAVAGIVGSDDVGAAIGNALFGLAIGLAIIGLVAFPIRYYHRKANPYRVARNLAISNVVFAVLAALGGWLTPEDFADEGENVNEVRIDLTVGFLMFALMFAAISFAIFFALSKARARTAYRANTETL